MRVKYTIELIAYTHIITRSSIRFHECMSSCLGRIHHCLMPSDLVVIVCS